MGTGSKVASVILRLGELCCAAIVTAILNRFFYLVNLGNGWYHGRLIYAEVIAILGIVVSIILLPPLKYSFYAWPIDVIVFVAWLVAFSLLANLTAGHTCSATWYWSYWGVYWGRFWNPGLVVTPALIGGAGCSSWTAVLTFLFMGSMAFLLSSILVSSVIFIHPVGIFNAS
ncbi:hypothetical protein BCR34DRAFT_225620 [Clohesyomyces aquaticus]|uniref:MARVEL domain-containing protein n=1 Tax=Clohesyomyces aquaticus TaxID=1231657 RepID=A0A1Y1Y8K7_9PLEO|nr:hypothetical protein BCR34DRAFT_225620 [Clohesyomyces aquaticus]